MPFNTLGVVSAVTPSVIETYFSHYLHRGPLRQKPTAHISYHEGLRLIRQFLDYSSKHPVEDLQAFTAQWVPAPVWCRLQDVEFPLPFLERSAELVRAQLGPRGIEMVGGKSWWVWRRAEQPMRAQWIDMKADVNEWKRAGGKCDRAILYVHGGAYYFGSVDEHRYQMQRHARKLKARVLAPRYRLAPQFPFPCGLYDCVAAYLFLLEHFAPSQILVAGDSAGGGMALSLLVTLRDQGVPLPAGAMLLSPWVDLTHSFPSVAGDGVGDYIPPHGFHHRPSLVWPPPNSDELRALAGEPVKKKKSVDDLATAVRSESKVPSTEQDLTIVVDGKTVQIKDQIQMYSTNQMLAHPLVSPVQQPSLGGLPPMLIQAGGAELLRDEQIYLAHKAANPKEYPPGERVMREYGLNRDDITRYPPTDVQLQVWDDLCHVPHTLSFTRPAKYMYRSVAQFGAWALAHAQQKPIVIMDDDQISIISDGPETDGETDASTPSPKTTNGAFPRERAAGTPTGTVGKAGDPLPRFKDHMIRQRVDRHGVTYALALPAELGCLHLDPESVGAIKPGPVRKWLARKKETDTKYASDIKKVQKKRLKELQQGYDVIGDDEKPPPTALAGRKRSDMPPEKRIKKSWGLAMWSGWGSSHDGSTIERTDKLERENIKRPESPPESVQEITLGSASVARGGSNGAGPESAQKRRRTSAASGFAAPWSQKHRERPVSPYRMITDTGQAGSSTAVGGNLRPPSPDISQRSRPSYSAASVTDSRPTSRGANTTTAEGHNHQQSLSNASSTTSPLASTVSPLTSEVLPNSTRVEGSDNTFQSPGNDRPHNGTSAYPFKLRNPKPGFTSNASTTTLNSDDPGSSRAATPQPQPDYSDKEMAIPFYEKEVVFNQPYQPYHSNQPYHSPHPSYPTHSDPPTPTDTHPTLSRLRSQISNPLLSSPRPASPARTTSVPTSPAAASTPTNPFSRLTSRLNPASPSQPGPFFHTPQKPVGFSYSPRDLRNAMLNRQAAETAAANSPADHAGPSFAAVELPAISLPPSRPDSPRTPASENSRPAVYGHGVVSPVELDGLSRATATTPAVSPHAGPMPITAANNAFPEPSLGANTTALREGVVQPAVEPRRDIPQPPPPPPPPKDDPATVQLIRKMSGRVGRGAEEGQGKPF